MEVTAVSNHGREHLAATDLGDIPFHHLPITKQTKMEQEAQIWRLVQETDAELVILARYEEILDNLELSIRFEPQG